MILIYISGFGINTNISDDMSFNSKWVYVKELLKDVDTNTIIKIADELEIDHQFANLMGTSLETPDFWKKGHLKLFLSHLSSFKEQTSLLQKSLMKYGISAFVAHEDIEPTKEWQLEIEKALFTMDALVAILTPGFNESKWTDQEIGVAIGRNVLVIPIRKGLDPYGFFGKFQGVQGEGKTIAEVSRSIYEILLSNKKTRETMITSIIDIFLFSKNEKEAEHSLSLIEGMNDLPKRYVERIRENVMNNDSVTNSQSIISRINELMEEYDLLHLDNDEDIIEISNDDLPF